MTDKRILERLDVVAAYLGTVPEEVARALRSGVSLEALAERWGRPVVGIEELVAQSVGCR